MWDWNGTLLADTALTARAEEVALAAVGLSVSISVERWREVSDRPVSAAIQRLVGRELSSDELATEGRAWLSAYLAGLGDVGLAPDAGEALRLVRDAGIPQSIVSMHPESEVRAHAAALGVADCFDQIVGSASDYDSSQPFVKATLIADLSARLSVPTADMVMIGDMLDDAEAARRAGARAVLVSVGDMSPRRLADNGFPVCDGLVDAVRCALGMAPADAAAG